MGDRAADLLDGMTAAEPPPTGHAGGVAAAGAAARGTLSRTCWMDGMGMG